MIGDPTIEVECDGCGSTESLGLTPLAGGGWDDRNVKRELERMGWIIDGDHTYCDEECKP